MTAAWLPYFDDGEQLPLECPATQPLNMWRLFGSEHALVYCACFRIQSDINRGPQRKSAGAFSRLALLIEHRS